MWDVENLTLILWNEALIEFNLTMPDTDDWIILIFKIMGLRRQILKDDPFLTHHGQWVGFYIEGADNPTFVLQCTTGFNP